MPELYGNRAPSTRELNIIRLVTDGLNNKTIALEIGTTEQVVKKYLTVIYDKLGMWNRTELALWYEAHRRNDS
jgi:DNA-binding NarL/FixJ family response regulator